MKVGFYEQGEKMKKIAIAEALLLIVWLIFGKEDFPGEKFLLSATTIAAIMLELCIFSTSLV